MENEQNRPSDEQQSILNGINNGENIIADCVPGSGKTSIVLQICQEEWSKKFRILMLTYNSKLKEEVRKKAEQLDIKHLTVHNYHSLYVEYYNQYAYQDEQFNNCIINNVKQKNKYEVFDLVIIDEAQDMKKEFYQSIWKFIQDQCIDEVQMILMGDSYQGVYKELFNTDSRYLSLGDQIWKNHPKIKSPFKKYPLSKSMRLPQIIVDYVNNFVGESRISTAKKNSQDQKINIEKIPFFKQGEQVAGMIKDLIVIQKYKEDDILILAHSLNYSNQQLLKLENILVERHGYKVDFTKPNQTEKKKDVIKGKIHFSTFVSAKGLERKVVIVFQIQKDYFQYYGKKDSIIPLECPAQVYVALTRASEQLIIIQSDNEAKNIESFQYAKEYNEKIQKIQKEQTQQNLLEAKKKFNQTSPTNIIQYLNISVEVQKQIDSLFLPFKVPQYSLKIDSVITTPSSHEEISDINGKAIPSIFQYQQQKTNSVLENLKNLLTEDEYIMFRSEHPYLVPKIEQGIKKFEKILDSVYPKVDIDNFLLSKIPISLFLELTLIFIACKDELYHRTNQITRFDWLNESEVQQALDYLQKHITSDTRYEVQNSKLEYKWEKNNGEIQDIHFDSTLDAINSTDVWEFKCVSKLSIDDKLQLIFYYWIASQNNRTQSQLNFKLMNILNGEILILQKDSPQNQQLIKEIVEYIIQSKFKIHHDISDQQFLNQIAQYDQDIKKYLDIKE